MPPSRIVKGGSSTMAEEISCSTSSKPSISWKICRSNVDSQEASRDFSPGSRSTAAARERSSLPLAEPYTIRVIMRSRSKIPVSCSVTWSNSCGLSKSSSTAFCRRVMRAGLNRGCSSQDLISRLPMAVFVRSSTHKREPFRSLLRSVSVSSKFRRAFKSKLMTAASPSSSTSFMRSNPVICVRPK